MKRSALAAAIICLLSFGVAAQVYVWKDQQTGTTYMQAETPSWYVSGVGPRIQLFIDGELIDDTAWTKRNIVKIRIYERFTRYSEDRNKSSSFSAGGTQNGKARASPCKMEIPEVKNGSVAGIYAWKVVMSIEQQKFDACQRNWLAENGHTETIIADQARRDNAKETGNAVARAIARSKPTEFDKYQEKRDMEKAAEEGTREAIRQCRNGFC